MPIYEDVIQSLAKIGVLNVVLPFMLSFVVVFAILQKTKVLGKESFRYNAMVSLVFGFLFIYFVDLTELLIFTSYFVILVVASVAFLLIIKQVGIKNPAMRWILLVVTVIFAIAALDTYIDWKIISDVLLNPATIMLAVMIGSVYFIFGRKGVKQADKIKKDYGKPLEPSDFEKQYRETKELPDEPYIAAKEKTPFFRKK